MLTYWLYTFIPWFYAFAAIALLMPAVVRIDVESPQQDPEKPVPAG